MLRRFNCAYALVQNSCSKCISFQSQQLRALDCWYRPNVSKISKKKVRHTVHLLSLWDPTKCKPNLPECQSHTKILNNKHNGNHDKQWRHKSNTVNLSHPVYHKHGASMASLWLGRRHTFHWRDGPTTTPIPTLLPTTSPLSKCLPMSYTTEYINYTQILYRSHSSSKSSKKARQKKNILIIKNPSVYVSSKERIKPNPTQ